MGDRKRDLKHWMLGMVALTQSFPFPDLLTNIKTCCSKLPNFACVPHRCWRVPSSVIPPLDGVPSAADVLVHMAGHTAQKREAVRKGGGVCDHGDTDGSWAYKLQADGPARPRAESKGEIMCDLTCVCASNCRLSFVFTADMPHTSITLSLGCSVLSRLLKGHSPLKATEQQRMFTLHDVNELHSIQFINHTLYLKL